jgi:hypothetical protein
MKIFPETLEGCTGSGTVHCKPVAFSSGRRTTNWTLAAILDSMN